MGIRAKPKRRAAERPHSPCIVQGLGVEAAEAVRNLIAEGQRA
jgi:hypothetical protein